MFEFNDSFCNKIAQLSIKKFNNLPKTGKPIINEWTILSCIAKLDESNNLEIVALGTGSKCIGAKKLSPKGDILNDSHAEIICRRSFLRYLYQQLSEALNKNDSIFNIEDSKFILSENVTFHFFTTHVPCGDAAIFPKQNCEDFGNCVKNYPSERPQETSNDCSTNKRIKIDSNEDLQNSADQEMDVFRTGAKCLTSDVKQDSKLGGVEYHTLGAVRTKPGRGDPTLSLSCSDKIAKWTFLGIQGALLSYFIPQPIFLSSFTIIGNTPFCKKALERSFKTRFDACTSTYKHKMPFIGQANDISFEFSKNETKRPCPTSIIWSNVAIKPLEISVDGKKQGTTKKNRKTKEGRLKICKQELFSTFIDIVKRFNILELLDLSYGEVKKKTDYYNKWNVIKSKIFKIWTVKDQELLNFLADE